MFTEVVVGMADSVMPASFAAQLALAQRIVIPTLSNEVLEYMQTHGTGIFDRFCLRGYTAAVELPDGVAIVWDIQPDAVGIATPRQYWLCTGVGCEHGVHEDEFMQVTGTVRVLAQTAAGMFDGRMTVQQWFHTTSKSVIDMGPDPYKPTFNAFVWAHLVRALTLLSLPQYQRLLT